MQHHASPFSGRRWLGLYASGAAEPQDGRAGRAGKGGGGLGRPGTERPAPRGMTFGVVELRSRRYERVGREMSS